MARTKPTKGLELHEHTGDQTDDQISAHRSHPANALSHKANRLRYDFHIRCDPDLAHRRPGCGQTADSENTGSDRVAWQSVHRELDHITTRHWKLWAEQCGVPGLFAAMRNMVDQVPGAFQKVAKQLRPDFREDVRIAVVDGLRRQRAKFNHGRN